MTAMALTHALERLGARHDLTAAETAAAVSAMMAGDASDVAIGAFLTALRVKGETADELAGAVEAVRSRMTPWPLPERPFPLLDTCGTGGDGAMSVNVSTATAVVVAACGVPVAKHGNRSASGNSGSAEVLQELGVDIEAGPGVLARCLVELGITFLFAPQFHPALRFAAPVRRQLPFRTLFNLIGPLANPARPDHQIIGVAGEPQANLIAEAVCRLGTTRVAVVTGADGLDEVTLDGTTQVRLVERGRVTRLVWSPADFGLPRVPAPALRVTGPADSAAKLRALFEGKPGPVRDMVLANSAAALWIATGQDLRTAVDRAASAVDNGSARTLIERWARLSRDTA
ncbi:MAG: anthranilate phosphoribosyltransferase [Isosphaeraceae bacterium]|nr:anthranilate phosphoribosyltransferase [Isosphaeraceae bacterium]